MLIPINNEKKLKKLMSQFLTVAVISALALLLLNVLSQDKDGRRQIIDDNGGEEYIATDSVNMKTEEEGKLASILEQIKGVGQVEVMISYHEENEAVSVFSSDTKSEKNSVKGVIIAAEGAGNVVIKNDIVKAVSSVFNIPAANVMVFEKKNQGGM